MSAPDARTIRNVQGRLIKDPTDLTLTDGVFGGTQLGLVKQKVVRVVSRDKIIRAEEFSSLPVEVIKSAQEIVLVCELRGYDADALSTIFPDVTTSTASGIAKVVFAGTTRGGRKGTDDAFKLLFAPRNIDEHPAMILYKAIPMLSETMELRLSATRELIFPVMFLGTKKNSGNRDVGQMGLINELDVS